MLRISRDSLESRRVISGQLLLIPRSARDLCAAMGVSLWTAVKWYEEGLLSYDPRRDGALDEAQVTEFSFLAALVGNGCDPAFLDGILASLPKPYCYRHGEIYYDWQAKKWQAVPEMPAPSEVVSEWIARLCEDGDRETLEQVRDEVERAIAALPPTTKSKTAGLPRVVCSADWSVDPHRRHVATAVLKEDGSYLIERISPVEVPAALLKAMSVMADGKGVMFGFDFPIGLPVAYANRRGFESWRDAMATLTPSESPRFYEVTDTPSLEQPFYPIAGGERGQHSVDTLVRALGLKDSRELFRECELATEERDAASCLFFTLGPRQVGRAALNGWATILCPNLDSVAVWPFDGGFLELLEGSKPVVAEVYPAQYYPLVGLPRPGWSKGRREDRQACAPAILEVLRDLDVGVPVDVAARLNGGFDSDDEFDALMGLIGMLSVLRGKLPADPPPTARSLQVEGWILGHSLTE